MSLLIAPLEALTDPRLSDTERRVLLALYSFRNKNADTVWPELPALAARALINDIPRVSKITGALREHGWLEKKKRGFTLGNEYLLKVPECFDANLANFTNLAGNTNANLANSAKSNLANSTKDIEQQIEHQIEHQIKTPRVSVPPVKKKTTFDPTGISFPENLNVPSWLEWCACRASRKKPITEFAAHKQIAYLGGYDQLVQAQIIDQSIANDWTGLFPPKIGGQHHGNQHKRTSGSNSAVGRVWSAIAARSRQREAAVHGEWDEIHVDGVTLATDD